MRQIARRTTSNVPTSLGRRGFMTTASATLLSAAAPRLAAAARPSGNLLSFNALRNGSPIGSHQVSFAQQGEQMIVTISVDYLVKFGFIPVFRYSLRGTETWRGDTLISAECKTNANGTPHFMTATRDGDSMLVEGSKSGRYRAPVGSITASHWNPRELDAPMINPEHGELLNFTVTKGPGEQIPLPGGRSVEARRYSLAGPESMDLWYDKAGVWSGLQAVAKDGSTISYIRS
jgi:hypothetical protein